MEICETPREIKLEMSINILQTKIEPNGDVSGKLNPKSHTRQRKVMGPNWPKEEILCLGNQEVGPLPPPDKQINLRGKTLRNPMHFQHMSPLISFLRCKIML